MRKNIKKYSKALLRRELKRLAICEFIVIPYFWFIYMVCTKEYVQSWSIIYALSLLCFILLQGSIYWYICLRRIDRKNVFKRTAYYYAKFKKINLLLILLYIPIVFICPSFGGYKIVATLIYGFSVLEYINYFYIRISYKNPLHLFQNLRKMNFPKSQIVKEIERELGSRG